MWNKIALGLMVLFLPLEANTGSSVTEEVRFTLQADGKNLRLSSHTRIERTGHGAGTAASHVVQIYEAPRTTLSNLRAECRGKALAQPAFSSYDTPTEEFLIAPGRVHAIRFPQDLRAAETVAYSYDQTFTEPAMFPMVELPSTGVRRFELTVEHPAGCRVDFEVFSAHDELKPSIQRDTPTRTSLVLENLPEPPDLPADPFKGEQGAILTRITRMEPPGEVTATTPETFKDQYLHWLEPFNRPDPAMRALLADELARAATPREQTRILFDFVKSHIRYVADMAGGHDYLPHPASQVLANKWGDCKDKASLLVSLAKLHGLPVHMVLLNTETAMPLAGVTIGLFNHAICALDDGGELVFMDPTSPMSELGDPPAMDLQARGFLHDPAHPRYVQVTALGREPALQVRVRGDLDQPQRAKVEITLRGAWRSKVKQARNDLNDRDFESFLARQFDQVLPRLPLEGFRLGEDAGAGLALGADADLSSFLVTAGPRVLAPRAPFQALDSQILDREKDAYYLQAPGVQSLALELDLAAPGLTVKPEHFTLGEAGGPRLTATATGSAGSVRLAYRLDQPYKRVPQDARAPFLAFCTAYLQANRRLFLLERSAH